MPLNKRRLALVATLLLLLATSITANFYLFRYSKQYYLQLNSVRLDPLALHTYTNDPISTEKRDPTKTYVVFFGDSRAFEWPSPTIHSVEFINRGIGAQTSAQIVERYDDHVKPLKPDILVLQFCINDLKTIPLFPKQKQTIIDNCKDNIQWVVQQATAQETTIILSTIFPVGKIPLERRLFWSDEVALAVNEVNIYIKSLAQEQVVIFDAFTILANEQGTLREEYSRDELHLNEAGYDVLNDSFIVLLQSLDQ